MVWKIHLSHPERRGLACDWSRPKRCCKITHKLAQLCATLNWSARPCLRRRVVGIYQAYVVSWHPVCRACWIKRTIYILPRNELLHQSFNCDIFKVFFHLQWATRRGNDTYGWEHSAIRLAALYRMIDAEESISVNVISTWWCLKSIRSDGTRLQ